jgi:hypothetical protein
MNKIKWLMLLLAVALGPTWAQAEPLKLGPLLVPFQVMNGTELYSFREGKGFPAAETVLYMKGRYQLTLGAAAVLGTDVNVPFLGIQHRLNPNIFDTSDNDVQFGAWVGKASRRLPGDDRPEWLYGLKASIPLW